MAALSSELEPPPGEQHRGLMFYMQHVTPRVTCYIVLPKTVVFGVFT
jgi:hypothetical protein